MHMKTEHRQSYLLLQKKSNWLTFSALLIITTLLFAQQTVVYGQLPSGFIAKKLTTNNIKEAVTMVHAADGRIFIAERSGALKQLKNGVVTTILTVTTTDASEQGLLGIALHSSFAQNGKIYLYYTNPAITEHYLDVVELSATSTVISSTRLVTFDPIINGYHNGGAMQFKDGLLYLSIGESNSPEQAPLLNTYRGKVLRLQDDGQPAAGNPYFNTAGASRQQRSIWAIGMRNPWFMSMDPQTKKIYNINVGAGYEEINDITSPDANKNYNYGWGADNKSGFDQNPATTILPVFAYNRTVANWNSNTCAITSGCAFNPITTNYPAQYRNKFYFGDWCANFLRSIDLNNPASGAWQELFPTGFGRILGLTTGIDGNLYYSEYGSTGNIWRIEYTLTQTPQIVNQPTSQTIYDGDNVSFSVSATGSNPLSYQWQKNGTNIANATGTTYTISPATTAHAGNYTVVVTNAVGSVTSAVATLTVKPFNASPIAKITSPTSSLTWNVGQLINYTGSGTDTEDGTLPASAYNWEVRVYHKDCPTCDHWHPGPNATDGITAGSFTAINGGESSSNIWLRLLLTVTDSQGRTGIDSVDIQPNKVDLTAISNPAGLQIVIGLGNTAPYTKTAVVNAAIDLQALTPQVIGNNVYTFKSWTHGGAANQLINVPNINTSYTANFDVNTISPNNLALNKAVVVSSPSNTNGQNAVDGNLNSRWESAYTDPQWIYVDLGASYSITRVKITWENAMGKDYRIEATNDLNNWGTPIKNVAGNSTTSNDWTGLTGSGRYLRIYGTARTTNYGYSIYELEVYGAPTTTGGNQAPSVSISSPQNNATFSSPASITINANAADADGTVSKVEFYNGSTYLGVDNTSPYSFTWTGVVAGSYTISAVATDNANASTTSAAIAISVTGTTGTNLALNKNATPSTILGGNTANNAVDGNSNSRWESAFADPQWIYVDLGAVYDVNRIKITWENAMAKDYRIEVSNDINNWGTPVKTVTGNATAINDWSLTGTGRYVRIYGTARTTGYGYSIFELEVYGTLNNGSNIAPSISITSPANNTSYTAPASIIINANATDTDGTISKVEFYNGVALLGSDDTAPYSFTWSNVATGTYSITAKAIDNLNASTVSTAVSVSVTGTTSTNLALNKPAFISSYENIANTGTYAVDGNLNTRWSSKFADPQWIYIDLGAIYAINRVKITWEAAKGKDYLIQISNDSTNWGTVPAKTVTGNTALINDWTVAQTGRYVRVYGTARTTVYGFSIYELEVYGTLNATQRIGHTEIITEDISLYPNPTLNDVTVKAIFSTTNYVNVTFIDSKGYVVFDKDYINTSGYFEERISLVEIPNGTYLVKLICGNEVLSQQLIKEQ